MEKIERMLKRMVLPACFGLTVLGFIPLRSPASDKAQHAATTQVVQASDSTQAVNANVSMLHK
ncbi:MAG: hypothetical protein JWN76_504 [Chitinophagaceae bacterium]|nr:hypothetical protein [Chitinophagaceae bacterium]